MGDNHSPELVVVTGGQSGIGLACAETFRAGGATVVSLDIADPDHPVDVTDADAVDRAFAALPGPPAVLVNAAGIDDGGLILEQPLATWRRTMSVNLDAAYLCLQAAARRMKTAGRGSVVNIASINATWPIRTASAYCASKAALVMLTKVAALELGCYGIRVNAVAPGPIQTPLSARVLAEPRVRQAMADRTPLAPRVGEPAEVADVVAFLASDAARWITGEVITIDGGQMLLGEPDVAVLTGAVTLPAR